jgi:hypothetical protein
MTIPIFRGVGGKGGILRFWIQVGEGTGWDTYWLLVSYLNGAHETDTRSDHTSYLLSSGIP